MLWGVTFLTFVVINHLPGNAAQELLGINATPAEIHQLSVKLGLDKPFLTRYLDWLHGLVTGTSAIRWPAARASPRSSASDLPVTFELLAYALLISLVFAVPIALLSARRPERDLRPGGDGAQHGRPVDRQLRPGAGARVLLRGQAQLAAGARLGPARPGPRRQHQVPDMPAVSIALSLLCFYTRLLRADLIEQLRGEDYVTTARAKGAGPWRVLMRHALRNSVFGLITVVALNLGTLLGATVVIEEIFGLPGIGHELLSAIGNRDVPVVEGAVLVFGVIVVLANLLRRPAVRGARPEGEIWQRRLRPPSPGATRARWSSLAPARPRRAVRLRAGAAIWVPAALLIADLLPVLPVAADRPGAPADRRQHPQLQPAVVLAGPPAGHRRDRQRRVVTAALRRPGLAGGGAGRQRHRPARSAVCWARSPAISAAGATR